MKYDIVSYGHPCLREKARPIAQVDDAIRQLAVDMLETMRAYNGIGLAAEQIARTEAICVVDLTPADERDGYDAADVVGVRMPLILVNPEVIAESDDEEMAQEGCLSFPEMYVDVRRPASVTVRYLSQDNEITEIRATGLLARAMQHEIDHLHGILISDRMPTTQKVTLAGKLKRMGRLGKKGGVVPRK
ncbi:MAG: peptide deformylase [Candidatus Promineifilaceae bacterium]|jgi:peptide deformylase